MSSIDHLCSHKLRATSFKSLLMWWLTIKSQSMKQEGGQKGQNDTKQDQIHTKWHIIFVCCISCTSNKFHTNPIIFRNHCNPSIPKPKLKNSKKKFNYKYHANILKLQKALLEDLKAALARHKDRTHSEHVWWVDVVAAVRVCLEQLMVQDQLNQIGAEILETYTAVFEPCPHTEELPKDVYCCIKLKDA